MKRKLLAMVLALTMILTMIPLTSFAAGGDFAAGISVTKNSDIQFNGNDTMKVDFMLKTGTDSIKSIQNATIAVDLTKFEFLQYIAINNTVLNKTGALFVEGSTIPTSGSTYAYTAFTPDNYSYMITGGVVTYRSGNMGYIVLAPDFDTNEANFPNSTSLMSILLGLKDGVQWDNIPVGSIRLATEAEAKAMNATAIITTNSTSDVEYVYNAKSDDTITIEPEFTASGFTFAKAEPVINTDPTATVTYGTAVADSALTGGVASVPGTFKWMSDVTTYGDASTTAKTLKAQFVPDDTDTYSTVKDIDVAVTVNAKAITDVAIDTITDQTYTGEQIKPTVVVKGDGGKTLALDKDYTVEYGTNKAVATAGGTVTVKAKTGGNYTFAATPKTFNIVAKAGTITISGDMGKTYDGQPADINKITPDPHGSKGTVTYKYYTNKECDEGETTTAPTNVGNYWVKASMTADANFGSATSNALAFVITQATPTSAAPAGVTAVYGQKLSDITLTNPTDNTAGTWSWEEPTTEVGDASAIAKEFEATFTPTDSKNYKVVENIEVSVTVGPKTITDVAIDAIPDKEFTGEQIKPVVVVKGDGGKTLALDTDYTVEYGTNKAVAPNGGTVTVKAKTGGNYTFADKPATFNIVAKAGTITISGDMGKTYDGNPADVSKITPDPHGSKGTVTYKYYTNKECDEGETTTAPTNAGNYWVKASMTADANFGSATSNALAFVITQATPTSAAPTGVTAVYGQKLSDITLTNPAGNTAGTWSWEAPTTEVGDASATAKKFEATFTPTDSKNYKVVENIEVSVTVGPKTITPVIADIEDQEIIQGGQVKPEIIVTDGNGNKLDATKDYTVSYGANNVKGKETGSVTISAKDGSNYTFTDTEKKFNIVGKKGVITISGTIPAKEYDGTASDISGVTPDKHGSTGDVTYKYYTNADCTTGETADAPVNAGSYWLKAFMTEDENYGSASSNAIAFTITQANPTCVAPTGLIAKYGDLLSTVALVNPTGNTAGTWSWADESLAVGNVNAEGNTFKATFTPDSANYKVVNNIDVKVIVGKADAPQFDPLNAKVKNDAVGADEKQEKSINNLMPADATNVTFEPEQTDTGVITWEVDANGAVAYYLNDAGTVGQTIELPVIIKSDNYGDAKAIIRVALVEKAVPNAKAGKRFIEKVYDGKAIEIEAINGNSNGVAGNWSWKIKVPQTVADSGNLVVIFTPEDPTAYEVVEDIVKVTIERATPTGAPTFTAITATGKTLADAGLDVGTINTAGTIAWDLADTTPVEAGVYYGWTFSPTDTANYNKLTGTAQVYKKSGNNGGGGGAAVKNFTLTFDTNEGSDIAAVTKEFGTTVDLSTYKPTKAGFVFDGWCSDKNLKNDITSIKMNANLTVYAKWVEDKDNPQEPVSELPFKDVSASAWYYGNVKYAVDNGLMKGTSDTMFSPEVTTTRGMIVTILYRLEKEPATTAANLFSDVENGKYYEKAVIWAADNEIVKGYGNGIFAPEKEITREELATIIYKYEQYKGGGFTGSWSFLLDYPDASAVSDWADEAMHWTVMNKIINGIDGKLVPQGDATRAQVAAMFERYLELADEK